MASYSSWNGQKMHSHRAPLTDLLKNELGFAGFVVSDWAGIDQLSTDYKTAIETAINAGVDMVMISYGPGQKNNYVDFVTLLGELVTEGKVPQSQIDDAVRRILRVKCRMKLFDHPMSEPMLTAAVGSAEHRQAARECVPQSAVLLKNEKGLLPLAKAARSWSWPEPPPMTWASSAEAGRSPGRARPGQSRGGTTILAASARPSARMPVISHSPTAPSPGHDAVLVVLGERPYAEMKGDSKDLALPAEDIAVLKKARTSGVPVVTVVLSGRPVMLGPVLESSDAVLAAWLPGTEGQGVADVLFGAAKPTGKLPHTWPKWIEQVPCNVGDDRTTESLFPFGYGLTY